MPKISVAMSVYNDSKYLEDAIKSILNQTYTDFEFIICNDASTDGSLDIIKKYKDIDKRIVLLENESNLGLSASLNRCIEYSSGEYIARMDADDISINNRFQQQVYYLETNPEVAFVCGDIYLIDEDGVWGNRINNLPLSKHNVYVYQPIPHPTVMMRKSVLDDVGGYTVAPYTRRGQDFDLWCKMYHKGYRGENIGEIVLYYRETKESYKKRRLKYRLHSYKLKKMWRKKLGFPSFYIFYALKPVVAGLIPKFLLREYHNWKFKGTNK